jgi:histone acetyltransferase (RNA polymerase elongator complex component)
MKFRLVKRGHTVQDVIEHPPLERVCLLVHYHFMPACRSSPEADNGKAQRLFEIRTSAGRVE